MTRAQILAKRKQSKIKNLSRIVKLEIRRSCAFNSIDKCLDQLKIGMKSMVKAGMIQDWSVTEDYGSYSVGYQRPAELGGEWTIFEFTLRLQNV